MNDVITARSKATESLRRLSYNGFPWPEVTAAVAFFGELDPVRR
jgi:hypothetical protein